MVVTMSLVGFVTDQMLINLEKCSIYAIELLHNIIINKYILVFIYIYSMA